MESVGKFEFSRKDLIGHGAFAVVFKGKHKHKRNLDVAIKCISKKNLAKTQALLGKEIKILKELKHDNIVRLLDYQEIGGSVYLVMEYCNGGDLAEYLHSKGTLSEDTIRIFLQQIAQAMKVIQDRGILHRDLKPQNILLCRGEGRRVNPVNTCIKIADFGFARHLQTNTMAATLCGSPMYMAPEVIMSQSYDAKADLWSIGTIVYQCLTGKAPFYASTPQELRLFYETNRTLSPSIPKETSGHLKHLLLGLLQRNPKDRMTFDEFFHHPFVKMDSSNKKVGSPTSAGSCRSSGSSDGGSSASRSHFASSPVSVPEPSDQCIPHSQNNKYNVNATPKDRAGFPLIRGVQGDIRSSLLCTDEYVMVPAQSPNEYSSDAETESPVASCLINSGGSLVQDVDKTAVSRTSSHSSLLPHPPPLERKCRSVPIPVPTQIRNFQRMEQNLQPAGLHGSTRVKLCCAKNSSLPTDLTRGGAVPQQSSPVVGRIPPLFEQNLPLGARTSQLPVVKDEQLQVPNHLHKRRRTVSELPSFRQFVPQDNRERPIKRSISTGRLSDMLLRAAYGATLFEKGSQESLFETEMDGSPVTIFAIDSSRRASLPTDTRLFPSSPNHLSSPCLLNDGSFRRGIRKYSETENMDASPLSNVVFHPPELPEDTLMSSQQTHTDALNNLRFTLAFVHCLMEVASSKDPSLNTTSNPDISFLEQSMLTDQISLLSREWSYATQLVLYMKAEDFLSSALHAAKEDIKQGLLLPSTIVKQVFRRLNDMYKCCVACCRSLNDQLQNFLLDKQKLIDRFNGLTAERIIYSHTVHMVQSAALDEMFHYGMSSVQRYHKALILMEGLSRILTEQHDIDSVEKCKQCIERRLSSLHT